MTKTWTKRQQANHRKKWIAALRSGEYRQTRGKLTDGKGFCCLGLACEISGLGEWVGVPDSWPRYEVGGNDFATTRLPNAVREWLGLSDSLGGYHPFKSLVEDNDDRLRFKTIADIIESEPEGLIVK